MSEKIEQLFTCPSCGGFHFNVGVWQTLVCANVCFMPTGERVIGCGWIGTSEKWIKKGGEQ
jgi:hypothetical protein